MIVASGTLCAQSGWSTERLLLEAASCCAVPAGSLSIAKPPTVGAKSLDGKGGAKLLASLKWDEPKIVTAAKVGAFPLQLRDGDVILLRDARTAGAAAATAGKAAAPTGAAKGRKGGNKPWQNASVVSGGAAPREAGLSIKTCYDQPPSAPATETAAE